MRTLAVLLPLSISSTALAQPQPVDPNAYPMPAPPMVVPVLTPVPCSGGRVDRDPCMKHLLEMDPQYLAARSRRNTGIVLTSVGTGVGLIVIAAAWASYMSRDVGTAFNCMGTYCSHSGNDYTGEKIAAIAGGALVIAGLAVGIPSIVSGSREMRLIRNMRLGLVPVPQVSVGPRQAWFGATWRF